MAIITETFVGDGSTKEFTVSSTMLSKSHVRVDLYYGSTGSKDDVDATDHLIPESQWDVLSATVLFDTAPANDYEVRITVSSDGTGLDTAPSVYATVASTVGQNILDIVTVGQNIDTIVTLSQHMDELTIDEILSGEAIASIAYDVSDRVETITYGGSYAGYTANYTYNIDNTVNTEIYKDDLSATLLTITYGYTTGSLTSITRS